MRDCCKKDWYQTTATMIERYGTNLVSNEQLLAAVLEIDLQNEANQPVADLFEGTHSLRKVSKKTFRELTKVKGIGNKKASAILAAFELGRRLLKEEAEKKTSLDNSLSIYDYIKPWVLGLDHEEAFLLILNQHFNLLKMVRLGVGGLTETSIDIRLIIKETCLANGTIIALVHNHPSNSPTPSKNDDQLTLKVQKACEVTRIFFMDHLIIGSDCKKYYSYHDKGKL